MRVEKFDPERTFSVLYYDGPAKAYYIKRFSFEPNNGIAVSFIADGKGSKLLEINEDEYPLLRVVFGGKNAGKEPELIDVAEYIGKKGFRAKGKKVSWFDIKSVAFDEPLVKEKPVPEEPEDDEPDFPEPDTPDEDPTEEDLTDWSNPTEPTLF